MAGIFDAVTNAVGVAAAGAVKEAVKAGINTVQSRAFYTPILDRGLPERANLSFYFPNPSEGSDYFRVGLPFYENPKITESKRARYKKHSLLARSSNLYTYLGADSRKINLSFNISLPHMVDLNETMLTDYVSVPDGLPEDERMKFSSPAFSFTDDGEKGVPAIDYVGKYYLLPDTFRSTVKMNMENMALNMEERLWLARTRYFQDTYIAELTGGEAPKPTDLWNYTKDTMSDMTLTKDVPTSKTVTTQPTNAARNRLHIIDVIVFWVNIIRTCVTNHATNPLYGPPIIRLRHGLLYQDVPCICTDYRVEWDEVAGYDVETLLPRRLKITLNLEEIRTGDFKEFDSMDIIKRDNLAGWESVIGEGHNADPGYDIYMQDINTWAGMQKREGAPIGIPLESNSLRL